MNGSILVVEDDEDVATLVSDGLREQGLEVDTVGSGQQALEFLRTASVDVLVTDIHMAGLNGIDLCREVGNRHPDLLTIVVTGQGALETAIEAIRAGAYDFITKPIKLDALTLAVKRAIDHLALRREVKRLRSVSDRDVPIDGITGSSPAIRETIEMVRRVADSDTTVLITGESGTGKELVARALHALSPRRELPFVAINCGAMPAPLLESELFGHVRGAFTDAKRSRPGLFVQAGAGTIFLDEVGEMPLEMQVKLLRVLQERKVRPVGGDEEVALEARVLTATNRELEVEVEAKRFREDLFYRINVVAIAVPPLRVRGADILVLAQHFLTQVAARTNKPVRGISPPAARMLVDYDWPGNVRELENCIERAVTLCRLDEITAEDLPAKIVDHQGSTAVVTSEAPDELITLTEMERRYVRQVLASVGGNKTHAARVLGIDRRSLYRRLDDRPSQPRGAAPVARAPTANGL